MHLAESRPFISFLSDGDRVDAGATALIYQGETCSYAELDRLSTRVAERLSGAGIGPGDHIAILDKNSIDFFVLLFGAMKAGAIATSLNWRLVTSEIDYILRDSESRILFFDQSFAPVVESLGRPGLELVEIGANGGASRLAAWLDGPTAALPRLPGRPDDIILQVYTSGTTGRPKGAMLSNASFMRYFGLQDPGLPHWWQTRRDDVTLIAMPVFHIGGLETALRVLAIGGVCVIQREFNPAHVLDGIEEFRPTLLALVPTALQMVLAEPRAHDVDFRCIRTIFYGAAPMPLPLLKQALQVARCDFVQCFGLTESAGTAVALPPEAHGADAGQRMQSAGRALPGNEIRIVDADGRDLPTGVIGEILLRSPHLMHGYWRQEAASAAAIDRQGWLHTGDAGVIDSDGFLYIQDRIKDMIVSGGENIYPAEVESALFGHPAVAEVAVIGIPDSKWGETVLALVVPARGVRPDAAELVEYARQHLAAYKIPRLVKFVTELPKNAAGKYLKADLRKIHAAQH